MHNQTLETKFFGPFRVLHPIRKQADKLEFLKKWRIYDVFHVSLLEQDTLRKERLNENATELDASNNSGKYEVKVIWDSILYARESELGHLPSIYYLIS